MKRYKGGTMSGLSRITVLLCTLLASVVLLLVFYIIMMLKIQAGTIGIIGLVFVIIMLLAVAAAIYFQRQAEKKPAAQEAPKDEPVKE